MGAAKIFTAARGLARIVGLEAREKKPESQWHGAFGGRFSCGASVFGAKLGAPLPLFIQGRGGPQTSRMAAAMI